MNRIENIKTNSSNVRLKSVTKDIAGIDIIKFFMAFAVIAIHSRVIGLRGGSEWPQFIEYFIYLAVPFFFIISGYLLAYKLSNRDFSGINCQVFFRKRSLMLFRIFFCWLVIYLPLAVYTYSLEGVPFTTAFFGYIYKVILSGHSLWAWQLWFIYSMAWILLFMSYLRFSKGNLIALAAVFCLISMVNWWFEKYGINSLKLVYVLTHKILGGVFILLLVFFYINLRRIPGLGYIVFLQ